MALRYETLLVGFAADDYIQLAMIDGTYAVDRSVWDLYNFSDGSIEEGKRLHHQGFYPPRIRDQPVCPIHPSKTRSCCSHILLDPLARSCTSHSGTRLSDELSVGTHGQL